MDKRMTPLQHMDELRVRLLRASVVTLIAVIIAMVFYKQILAGFTAPIQNLLTDAGSDGLLAIKLTETWSVAARLAFLAGIGASLPVYMLEIAMYFRSALKPSERIYLYLLPPSSTLMFAGGAAFAYFILAPQFFGFLIGFSIGVSGLDVRPSLDTTVGLIISFMFWMGAIFQLPIVMFFLSKAGIVTSGTIAGKRRWVIVGAFIFGAVITPTADPMTQIMAAGPVIVLFELGYLLVRLSERGQRERPSIPTSRRETVSVGGAAESQDA